MKKKYIIISCIFLILLTLDLVSKYLMSNNDVLVIIPNILEFRYSENTGAAFSSFSNNIIFLIVFTIIILGIFIIYDILCKETKLIYVISFALVISGAVGNLIDRIVFRYVRDFIYFPFINFPIFNIADICITFGIILFAIYLIFLKDKNKEKND